MTEVLYYIFHGNYKGIGSFQKLKLLYICLVIYLIMKKDIMICKCEHFVLLKNNDMQDEGY
jgi:hypothetical protein